MPEDFKNEIVAGTDRRRFTRYSLTASAEATDVNSQTLLRARVSDLSQGGCYVDTMSPFIIGTDVNIRIAKAEKCFSAKSKVVYSAPGMGMGLIFTAVEPVQLSILYKWLAELSGEQAPAEATQEIVENQGSVSSVHEVRDVLSEIIVMLVQKQILTDTDGKAMLQKLSHTDYAPR
jgi:hypothetical protein